MELLTDGSVMGTINTGKDWEKLTPDATGSYANGTWSPLASMSTLRLYDRHQRSSGRPRYGSGGGQYTDPPYTQTFTNTGEIYNPLTNTWTAMANFPEPTFGASANHFIAKWPGAGRIEVRRSDVHLRPGHEQLVQWSDPALRQNQRPRNMDEIARRQHSCGRPARRPGASGAPRSINDDLDRFRYVAGGLAEQRPAARSRGPSPGWQGFPIRHDRDGALHTVHNSWRIRNLARWSGHSGWTDGQVYFGCDDAQRSCALCRGGRGGRSGSHF